MTHAPHPSADPPKEIGIRDDRARAIDSENNFTLFAFLWACFLMFHFGKRGEWTESPLNILLVIAAIPVLFRPANLTFFMVLIATQLAVFAIKMPSPVNHVVFSMLVALTIAYAIVREAAQRTGLPIDRATLYENFAPAIRLQVILLYFFVVLHKLNTDFFLPEYSAAVVHYQNLSKRCTEFGLPALPTADWAYHAAIYGTLILEAAIPIMLIFRRTRVAGIWVALLFHFMLGMEDFFHFSAMIYALLVLFVPQTLGTVLIGRWKSSGLCRGLAAIARAPIFRTIPPIVWGALVMVVTLKLVNVFDKSESFLFFRAIWLIWTVGIIVAFAWVTRGQAPEADSRGLLRLPSWTFALFPMLVLLNGACPYLGLKTQGSFAMFSNLRTEGGTTNHLLIPAEFRLFSFQDDLVQILESSDQGLQKISKDNKQIPYFLLRKIISDRAHNGQKNIVLRYIRSGREFELTNAELDPELSKRHPMYLRKLLTFSPVSSNESQESRH